MVDFSPPTWDMGDYLPQEYFDYVCKIKVYVVNK